ncbi:uncharacterized protein TA13005 [Theileria annulata]|uniref:Uncharacterized protein n=1 Tax=Theileria annulata TaxID=5874 RepID=Q4UEB0_THEAN|nr:uncharacterized protein TA13005 [Theileria annulata]CAI74579.1 hypothetical protein, conserved [Theileria annulata]|eukprot:XP_952311.1 hypothetical protein, conserved [Theileria annulata]
MDCKLSSSYKIIPTRLFQTSSFSDVTVEKPITKPISNSNTRCVLSKNLEDLLYVDDLNDEEVIVCLLRRFFRQKYFTYFGKVLFFLQPDRDILTNSSQFLYSDLHNQCHLYSFLKQIFAEFISSDGVCIFFHGDSNDQLHTMNKSLIFLLKLANIQGFQGAEELNVRINDVMRLLEYWTSDSTNLMTSYKINFVGNCVESVNFIPNFATDFSSLSGHVNMKLPSIFYGLIYSILKGKNLHWITYTLPLQLVKELLNSIPHILDPIQHINNFSHMMNIMMKIGFMVDELREMNKVLLSILIFNYMSRVNLRVGNTRVGNLMELLDLVCNLLEIGIMKESNTNLKSNDIIFKAEIKKSTPEQFYNIPTALFLRLKHLIYTKINQFLIYQTVEPDKNSTKNSNRNGIVDGVGTNSTKNSNTKSTNDSSTKNSNTRYDSSTLNTNNDENINEYQLRSIIMYNNCIMDQSYQRDHSNQSGQPNQSDQSDDLNKFIINISEEMLLNKFYKVVEKKFGYPIDSEIVQRNKLLVNNLTGQMGLLTQITSQSIKLYNEQKLSNEPIEYNEQKYNEQKYNEPIEYNTKEYNMKKIIEMESKLYILNPIIKLLKYSKNSILKSLLFTNNSLHRFVGNLTFLLSYYSYINSEEYHWYFISCTTKQQHINRDIQQDIGQNIEKLEFDKCVNKLYNFYTNHIPILEICNMERNNNKVKYDLEQYTRYNYSLLYKFTNVKLHKTLKQLTNEQIVKLLFKSLNINENMYEIDKNIITIRMTIQIRILTLIEEYNTSHKKVIVIQNWYKTRKYISLKRQLINNFIRIQSLIRMKLINKTIKLQNQAKIITNQFISMII